jgi:hypothetical protein
VTGAAAARGRSPGPPSTVAGDQLPEMSKSKYFDWSCL